MNKGNIIVILAVLILASLPVAYFLKSSKKAPVTDIVTVRPTQAIPSTVPTATASQTVPLPTGEDVIRTFFNLINEKRIPEAISMMDEEMVPNDQIKQGWGSSLDSFSSVKVIKIVEYNKQERTEDSKTYLVSFDLAIKPGSNVIWEQGQNDRFIILSKKNNVWKIHGINTGP